MYPIRISEGLAFEPKTFVKKTFQKWVEPINGEPKGHFVKSDVWVTGLKPIYTFKLADGKELELSRDQVQQVLITAFDVKRNWFECLFVAKSNGKEKLEKRWFVNMAKKEGAQFPENPAGQEVPPTETNPEDVPF